MTICPWSAIKEDFRDGLVLGNGASIAFDDRFNYRSLRARAQELGLISDDIKRIFDNLETADFELVLRMLWHASRINDALGVSQRRTTEAYHSIRNALIRTVRDLHVPHAQVSSRIPYATAFLSRFTTVVSLSYDVLVYWASLAGNEESPNRFKDCFVHGEFQQDWEWLRTPYGDNNAASLVVFPHGSLAIAADLEGREFKVRAEADGDLLSTIFALWLAGEATPVFVSEGTSDQKRAAIRRSPYLSTVYEQIMPDVGGSIVVFGWSMHDADDHLLEALCRRTPRRFAVAANPEAPDVREFQGRVERKIRERLRGNPFELVFFDRYSEGCWLVPEQQPVQGIQ